MEKTCETCRWLHQVRGMNGGGKCHGGPPVTPDGDFPRVMADDWCRLHEVEPGEHQPREGEA